MPGLPKWIQAWQNIKGFEASGRIAAPRYSWGGFLYLLILLTVLNGCNQLGVITQPTPQPVSESENLPANEFLSPSAIPTPTAALVITSEPGMSQYDIQEMEIKLTGVDPIYEIHINKPVLSGGDKVALEFNRLIDMLNQEIMDGFIKSCEEEKGEPFEGGVAKSQLTISNDLNYFDGRYSCVSLNVMFYVIGSNRPTSYTKVINYDIESHRYLELKDLFISEDSALQKISSYCIEDLNKTIPGMFSEEALTPDSATFYNWSIAAEGLIVRFNPYTIGPGAIGTKIVTIPWKVLSDEIDPMGPAGGFIQ